MPAAVITDFDFVPGFHVHYQETVHHNDGRITKYAGLAKGSGPKEAGGSGIELPE